ncbi:MAG TPA: S8 family serine peptidase [Mycobacteriales bacterium]|nr:S8 family serine peptidase [Mycobacteriales bacterium]
MRLSTRTRAIAVLAAAGASLAGVGATGAVAAAHDVRVIVQADSVSAARAAVTAVGGRTSTGLPIVSGVAARIPADARSALAAQPGVVAVTPDRPVAVSGTADGTTISGTPSVFRHEVGADTLATTGDTGKGAVVALIDTGVTPGPDLTGRLVTGLANPTSQLGPPVDCINFSGESTCADNYGHGTFMAGLIAGNGAQSGGSSAQGSDGCPTTLGMFAGVAPCARIVSIKIAGADGSSDVTKLLAAIQWVVSFKDTYGISVLNLSLGTDSAASASVDPLNRAVERAWQSGLAVVVAAGNIGPKSGTIMKPGDDPLVITAGAADDRGTPAVSDDRTPDFTSRGPTITDGLAKPDVVAPGGHIIGLQAPGSAISKIPTEADLQSPNYNGAYRRGSGTSMSTAITSGVAALVWSQWSQQPGFDPTTWPDRLKFALTATAQKVSLSDPSAVGAGLVNAFAAVNAPAGLANRAVGALSDGSGTLDNSRNDLRVFTSCTLPTAQQCAVAGQQTAQGRIYFGQQYAQGAWTASSWYASQFAGQSWEATSWASNACPRNGATAGACAQGQSWEGQSWEGQSWESSDDPSASYGTPIVGSASYGAWG